MPKSETGLARDQDPKILVGTETLCEVIEIDRERQRVLLSRKQVLKKQRATHRQQDAGSLKPGQVVHGRVARLEDFGAFVRFGQGLEGLIHISNLSFERVGHPSEVLEVGQTVEAKVLTIRRAGKRIGLGLKQMHESPWKALERTHSPDQIVMGRVTRIVKFGAFVSIVKGVEALLHVSQAGLGAGQELRHALRESQEIPVRILDFDIERERMSLSRLHRDGSPLQPEEVWETEPVPPAVDAASPASTNLGNLLSKALPEAQPEERGEDAASDPVAG